MVFFARIGARWQDIGAIHGSQYAFQSGKATEGPLKIFTGVTQDAYLKRGPLHSLTHDISRAYDNVEQTIGKEILMGRLGVPEWLIDIVSSLDNEAQVSILTAHGLSVPFHPETGWPQGSEEGPLGWLTHLTGYCRCMMRQLIDPHTSWIICFRVKSTNISLQSQMKTS